MKLHAHKEHVDYHPIAPYVKVFLGTIPQGSGLLDCGRTELKGVFYFDISSGKYECYDYPLRVNEEGEAVIIKGQSDSLTFEISIYTPDDLINSWYDRELGKCCMSHINKLKENK